MSSPNKGLRNSELAGSAVLGGGELPPDVFEGHRLDEVADPGRSSSRSCALLQSRTAACFAAATAVAAVAATFVAAPISPTSIRTEWILPVNALSPFL